MLSSSSTAVLRNPCRECGGEGRITLHLYVETIVDGMARGAKLPLGLNAGGDIRAPCPYCNDTHQIDFEANWGPL